VAPGPGVRLGRGVVVETRAVVEAEVVGEGTVVEVGGRVGKGARVGRVSFVIGRVLLLGGGRGWVGLVLRGFVGVGRVGGRVGVLMLILFCGG